MSIELLILVHTEEAFDWSGSFSKENTDVSHILALDKYQKLFDSYNATVAYALTYPVLEEKKSIGFFKKLSTKKNILIGMHCHPWVTPPYKEKINKFNSFPSNLPEDLEQKKIETLYEKIKEKIGLAPLFYLAGRYGVRDFTYKVLNNLGVKYDFSKVPFYDYSGDDGPNFSNISTDITYNNNVAVIPHSSGFTGWLCRKGEKPWILNQKTLVKLKVTSIFSLLGGFSQVLLTPEGFSLNEMKDLTRKALRSTNKVLVLSFHSPSIIKGNTPFVCTEKEEIAFFKKLDEYLFFYDNEIKGKYLKLKNIKLN